MDFMLCLPSGYFPVVHLKAIMGQTGRRVRSQVFHSLNTCGDGRLIPDLRRAHKSLTVFCQADHFIPIGIWFPLLGGELSAGTRHLVSQSDNAGHWRPARFSRARGLRSH